MPTTEKTQELLARSYDAKLPISNCAKHKNVKITDRSIDCPMCAADMRDMMRAALAANQWLCKWQEDAIELLKIPSGEKPAPVAEETPLRSEADAEVTSALPLHSKDGSVLTVDALSESERGVGFDTLRLARIHPNADPEQITYVRVVNPTRQCAELAVEILRAFVHGGS